MMDGRKQPGADRGPDIEHCTRACTLTSMPSLSDGSDKKKMQVPK